MLEKSLIVSTVGRGKNLEESSNVYKLDLQTREVVAKVRLPLAMFDLENPRGGVRGCRGLAAIESADGLQIWAAGFDGLFCLDSSTLFINKGYWFKDIRDIHNIYSYNNHLLVLSTWNNSIYEVSPKTGKYKLLHNLTNYFPGPVIGDTPDQYHINSLCGDLVLLNKLNVIARRSTGEIVYSSRVFSSGHDLVPLPSGEIASCSSGKKRVIAFRIGSEEQRTLLDLNGLFPSSIPTPEKLSLSGWTRGLAYSETSGRLYAGAAPAKIFIIDPASATTIDCLNISDDVVDSTFAILPLDC